MGKANVIIHASNLVLDEDDAMALFKILNKTNAEKLDYDYKPKEEGKLMSQTIYYVESHENMVEIQSLRDEDYAMMKLFASTRENP